MVFVCHPEASCLSSPKDRAPRANRTRSLRANKLRVWRGWRVSLRATTTATREVKNGTKFGLFRFVGAVFRVSGPDFTGASFQLHLPTTFKLLLPLCTTFDHILALQFFIVKQKLEG